MQPDQREQVKSGAQAVAGVVIAIIGALAAARPQSVVLRVLSETAPQLGAAIPTVITACGAIIAAFSQPPRLK